MSHNFKLTSFVARSTAYYPDDSPLEGGFVDRLGKPLCTLQDHLKKKAVYVSVAMDVPAFPYGTKLCIPELNEYYGQDIDFRVVDTGGAFKGKKRTRIDICVKTEKDSFHHMVNQLLYVVAVA